MISLRDAMVWEMFHALLNPLEIPNSAFSIVVWIPRQMENPQGNNQPNNTDKYLFLGIHPQ